MNLKTCIGYFFGIALLLGCKKPDALPLELTVSTDQNRVYIGSDSQVKLEVTLGCKCGESNCVDLAETTVKLSAATGSFTHLQQVDIASVINVEVDANGEAEVFWKPSDNTLENVTIYAEVGDLLKSQEIEMLPLTDGDVLILSAMDDSGNTGTTLTPSSAARSLRVTVSSPILDVETVTLRLPEHGKFITFGGEEDEVTLDLSGDTASVAFSVDEFRDSYLVYAEIASLSYFTQQVISVDWPASQLLVEAPPTAIAANSTEVGTYSVYFDPDQSFYPGTLEVSITGGSWGDGQETETVVATRQVEVNEDTEFPLAFEFVSSLDPGMRSIETSYSAQSVAVPSTVEWESTSACPSGITVNLNANPSGTLQGAGDLQFHITANDPVSNGEEVQLNVGSGSVSPSSGTVMFENGSTTLTWSVLQAEFDQLTEDGPMEMPMTFSMPGCSINLNQEVVILLQPI